jgi:hypothetical protein
MKIVVTSAVLTLTFAAIAPAAHATPQAAIVLGSGAVGEFDQLSADGCTHTFGEIAVVQATRGAELADGLYVTGMQEDLCGGGFGNGFAGYATGQFYVIPLLSARYIGSLVAPSYSGGASVTLELDLRWTGHGAISKQGGVFHDGSQISFDWSRSRAATTKGTFLLDGEPANVTSATLVFEAHGTVEL